MQRQPLAVHARKEAGTQSFLTWKQPSRTLTMAPLRNAKQPAAKAKKTRNPVKNVHEKDKEELSLLCDEELKLSSPARDACKNVVDWLGDDETNPSSRRSSFSSANGDVVEYSLSTKLSEEMGKLIFGDALVPQEEPEREVENFRKSLQFADQPLFPLNDATRLPLKAPSKFLLRMRPVTPENPERHLFSNVGAKVRPTFSPPSRAETVASKTVTPNLATLAPEMPVNKKRPSLTTSKDKTPASKKKQKTTASSTKANVKGRTIPEKPLAMTTPKKKTTNVTVPSLLPSQRIMASSALKSPIAMLATVSTAASTFSAASARTASSRSSILSILSAVQSGLLAARAPPTPTRYSWSNPQDPFQAQQPCRHPSGDVRLFDDDLSEDGHFQDDADFGLANARDILEPDTSVYMCDRRPTVNIPIEIATGGPAQHLDNRLPWFPVQPPVPLLPPSSPWSSIGHFYERRSSSGASVPVHEYGQPPVVMMPMPASQSAFYGTRTRASLIDDDHADGIVNGGSDFLEYNELPSKSSVSLGPHFHPLPLIDRSSFSSKMAGSRQPNRDPSILDDDFGGLLRSIASISSPNGPLPPSPNRAYHSPQGPLPHFPF